MPKIIDLTGKRFGKLIVIKQGEYKQRGKRNKVTWDCKCDCGNLCNIVGDDLRIGCTTSCGCFHKEIVKNLNRKHGYSHKEPLYNIWKSMRQRCYCKSDKSFKNYGGRGITMCKEWLNSYEAFRNWAFDNGYKRDALSNGLNRLTIDRIDNDKDYSPENCRWVTNKEQARNKRNTIPNEERFLKCIVCGKEFAIKQRAKRETCSYKCMGILRSRRKKNKDA